MIKEYLITNKGGLNQVVYHLKCQSPMMLWQNPVSMEKEFKCVKCGRRIPAKQVV